jgi:hypothetical protein
MKQELTANTLQATTLQGRRITLAPRPPDAQSKRGVDSHTFAGVVAPLKSAGDLRENSPSNDQTFSSDGDAGPGDSVSFHGGAVIISPQVQLIFWGSRWAGGASPTETQVTNAIADIIAGPYLLKLRQYGIGPATLHGVSTIVSPDPPSPFSVDDVRNFIWDLIDQGEFPEPDDPGGRNFYAVIMPDNVVYDQPNVAIGAHSVATDFDLPADIDKAWFCWVGNDGTLDTITSTFSHELVEAITDPEDDGWQMSRSLNGGNEIGDACRHGSARLDGVLVQAYWSQRDRSCIVPIPDPHDWSGIYDNWRPIGGVFSPGAKINAVARTPNNLDLFVVGNDGIVYTSWWTTDSDWSGVKNDWRPIGGFFPPGAPIVAVARTSNNLDLFVVGNDGVVYTSWWAAGSDWSGVNNNWKPIGGIFPKGAPLAAVSRTPNNLDLFVVGNDGVVYTSWWAAGSDWSGVNNNWKPVGGIFPKGAPLAAVARTSNNLDLFVVGNNGVVYTSWWVAGSDWSGIHNDWRAIGGYFKAGASLAALARTGNNLDVFVVGNDGVVYTSWWAAGSDWSGTNNNWRPIGGFFPVAAPLAVISRTGDNLDAFVVGNDGVAYTSAWSASSDWSGANNDWRPIGGFFPAGAPIAALSRNPGQMDLFVCGNDGVTYTESRTDNPTTISATLIKHALITHSNPAARSPLAPRAPGGGGE